MINETTIPSDKTIFICETRHTLRKLSTTFAFLTLFCLCLASWHLFKTLSQPEFIPPEFDDTATLGVPDSVIDDTSFQYLKIDTNFEIGLCGKPYIKDNDLFLYFTNPANNENWLLVLLLNASGVEIGRSGVLKPGEYVASVGFSEEYELDNLNSILIKIISYEPNTYESKGTVTLNPQIYAR